MHRALFIWLGLMVLAILNGGIREGLLVPRFGSGNGHIISTLLLGAIIIAVACIALPWMSPASIGDALQIGLAWLVLTLAFEFLAGHYLFGQSWQALLADYNIRGGRIWPLIPLITLVAPAIAFLRSSARTPS